MRTRREVVQHAAAFQYIIQQFVKNNEQLSEDMICQMYVILTKGLSASEAGTLNNKPFGGVYCSVNERALAGFLEYAKPTDIPKAMRAMVIDIQKNIERIEKSGAIDPFMRAARYCDRFVNIHSFKDGN